MFDVKKLSAIKVGLASPETIRKWSHGEVLKPETINYRSQKPEMQGLYCEKIFGPSKDYECHCGRYKKIRYSGVVCEKCGVEVISKEVRRERMGHIELASPCTHIWYLKGIPSRIGLLLDVSPKHLEEVAYYAAHICLNPGKSEILTKSEFINEKNGRDAFIPVIREIQKHGEEWGLMPDSDDYLRSEELISRLENHSEVFDFETNYRFIRKFTGAEFSEGAAAIKRLLADVDLDAEAEEINRKMKGTSALNRTKLTKRLEVIEAFRHSDNKPEWMVLDVIPVIPPDLRPMLQLDGGRFATSDLNDLYRRVISRNNRLKKLIDMNSPAVLLFNEKRMLQEAVDALIDNGRRNKPVTGPGGRPLKSLSSGLKGKQGRFRQNLLGKRVDYSGRSVIAVGPFLKMYQCGLPREMAVQLLRPFIACELLKRGIANAHKQADKIIDRYDPQVLDIVEEIIGKHPVLLNRAPTLHRLGIQAFQPCLVDGRAIRLHPLVCTGFNADFDGDQMAVHVPLSKAAQEEALHLMLASNNILGPKDGKPIVTPSQDMVLGNYYLTLESTKEDFLKKADAIRSVNPEYAERLELYAASEGKVFRSVDDVLLAYQTRQIHLHNRIAIIGRALTKKGFTEEMNRSYLITSVGKVIFNQIFPSDFPYLNAVNSENISHDLPEYFVPMGTDIKAYIAAQPIRTPVKKGDLGKIINEIFQRYDRKGNPKTSAVLDKMKDQGFQYATVAGFTISIDDIHIVEGKQQILDEGDKKVAEIEEMYDLGMLTDEERHNSIVEVWNDVNATVRNKLTAQVQKDPRNPIFMMSDSGARGNISNITQLAGMRGLMGNTSGGTIELPVKRCFREGMTVSEFFIATHGARKGGTDTALKTADSGYLTRRLVDVSQDVIVREVDCGTDHGFVVKEIRDTARNAVVVKLYDRLVGRYALNDVVNPKTGEVIVKGNTMINEESAKAIIDAGITEVEIRSLFGCETKDGVCVHCYGRNLATGREVKVGEAVGIMAAQSIGEPGTQLTMRTFHTGGVAGSDITQGLPRVQELFEARNPKGEALISEIPGEITKIEEKNGCYLVTVRNDLEEKTYTTSFGAKLRVKKGDMVTNGGKITEGAIDPKKLLEVSDVKAVERYIVKEVQKVYSSQSIGISDKHIEVIVRQMLRKVFVIDAGDTDLIAGTRVSLNTFTAKNNEAIIAGKRPAVFSPLILGITKAALETDSFLSAASFQETTRVLTDAAIKGKTDYLHGLKENVITGHLIPAGRGLLSEEESDELLKDFSVEKTMHDVKDKYVEDHDRAINEIHEKISRKSEEIR
ncbi:MAG: DNA-directed RNA polymerase subunit beta' [Bacilli bacterium]|nr:DNA-directed RNA polymerase subunit beta' [Bacilli bacterium]MBP3731731.1 DNA-directed RNA polymerase subunit beta' [Bacilli bacterium]